MAKDREFQMNALEEQQLHIAHTNSCTDRKAQCDGHHHDHDHHHDHHHAHIPMGEGGRLKNVFYWAIGLNLGYVILEAVFGFSSGSMGLLSDAGHNLSDVASLLIALIAFKASQRPPTPRFSYGYGKATIEASLLNAVILYVAVIFIVIEAVERLLHPVAVDGGEIAWVAGAGVVINGVTAWMLMRHSHSDLNVKGACLHMIADTLVSVGVVGSGIVIGYTGWNWLDPAVGIVIAVVIAVGSWSLLRESLRMALDGVPADVDIEKVEQCIAVTDGVSSFHHLHIWPLSTTANALTVHVVVPDPGEIDRVTDTLRESLRKLGIAHVTIEAETAERAGCHDCVHAKQ